MPFDSRDFFDKFAQSRSALNIDLIASQYADSFMFATPIGPQVKEKQAVLAAFPKVHALLSANGHLSTEVVSMHETALDAHYVLARVRFLWRFVKSAASQPVDVHVESTFIVYIDQGAGTIVFQHEHQDFAESLHAHGVLPYPVS
jgi:hypothetical protein